MRPIRGPRHAADDERTVEAPPEEATLSAGLDVRAAFEAQDKTIPGAVVGLVPLDGPIEEDVPRQERTIPLVSPEAVLQMRAQSQARLAAAAAYVPPPPASDPVLPPPSDPVLVNVPRDPFGEGESAVDIPGVGGAQRKRMLRIVIGVLSVCGLLCVGALARQLLGSKESESSSPTATATVTATATATATETATASATAAPSVVASAEPAPTPIASAPPVVATAAPEPPPAPPPPPPPPPVRARTPEPPPPARRPAAAAPAPHPRAAGAPATAKGRPPIVRDSPF